MLSAIHGGHARRSGYGLLADYIPGAEFLHAPRADPKGAALFFARLARRGAFSRWYLGGSAQIEWQAFRRLRAGFDGPIHSMWADHDLGFLDLVMPNKRRRFCGTFHNCPDDFRHTIRFPSRLKSFAAIVLMSECQRAFFRSAGVADDRIHVVLHGVDTDYFTPATRPRRPIDRALRRRLSSQFSAASAGLPETASQPGDSHRGRRAARLSQPVRGIFRTSTFLTGLDDETLLAKYRGASCLLHTAEQATANNVLLEALACGVPIVAERVGGIPEYVTPECSILTEPRDVDALADAVAGTCPLTQSSRTKWPPLRAAAPRNWRGPKVAARMMEIYRTL